MMIAPRWSDTKGWSFIDQGEFNVERVQDLKYERFNPNVVSFNFVADHRELFRIVRSSVTVGNSKNQSE